MMRSHAQQQACRNHIINVALGIADTGGYEDVKMRAVADAAKVAVGTVYRYFPSKQHLLVAVLESELDRVEPKWQQPKAAGADDYEQLWRLISRLNAGMSQRPRLAEAMARGFIVAYTGEGQVVDQVRRRLDAMFVTLLAGGHPSTLQRRKAAILVDVWVSNALCWINRRATTADINRRARQLLAVLASQDDGQLPATSVPD